MVYSVIQKYPISMRHLFIGYGAKLGLFYKLNRLKSSTLLIYKQC